MWAPDLDSEQRTVEFLEDPDLWLFLGSTLVAGGLGLLAYRQGSKLRIAFSRALAESLGGTAEGETCVVDLRGMRFEVRRIGERRGNTNVRTAVEVRASTRCPAYFTLRQVDPVTRRAAEMTGPGHLDQLDARCRIRGYDMESPSPTWVQSWLAGAEARNHLQALAAESITLLRLGPDGVECRRLMSAEELRTPGTVVGPLVDALRAVLDDVSDHRPGLVPETERAADFKEGHRLLWLPFGLLVLSLPMLFASIALTERLPKLAWGVEVELIGAAACLGIGLPLFHRFVKERARTRENSGDVYLSSMMLMAVTLFLVGAAVSRPLVHVLV
ncbi:MAG: hypothetical protein H6983_24575 [Ectothiorhodospiraceae bacterium]|nr:hypothetical protein [Ectothiorhodospiraceae bacterium]